MRPGLAERSAELRAGRQPFVHARVVLAERPTSARPGDEAIVRADGTIEGFVGGSCAEASVRQQALAALGSGDPVLLRITPDDEPARPGEVVAHNPCLSGGTLEVFLEPFVPPPLVQVVGESPIATALAELGRALGYAVSAWAGRLEPDAAALVVASHGRDEEGPLVAALEAGLAYVGLVASSRRGPAVVAGLEVRDGLRSRVRTPAGLDIKAATAEEVALSILAEIVAARPRAGRPGRPPVAAICTAVDPVCGMVVQAVESTPHRVHPDPAAGGRIVWFCGPGCERAFAADPGAFPPRPAP